MIKRFNIFLFLIVLSGCHASKLEQYSLCPNGHNSYIKNTLYFGLAIPSGGTVSKKSFTEFLKREVTPIFPEGFTVLEARGQWRGNDGKIVEEPSKALVFLSPASESKDSALLEIIEKYRKKFKQEAVLWERDLSCVKF